MAAFRLRFFAELLPPFAVIARTAPYPKSEGSECEAFHLVARGSFTLTQYPSGQTNIGVINLRGAVRQRQTVVPALNPIAAGHITLGSDLDTNVDHRDVGSGTVRDRRP